VGVGGTTSTGTSWEIGADLGYNNMTTVSSLGGVQTEQVRKNWTGLVDLGVSQDVLAPFRQSTTAIAARQAGERLDVAELAAAQTQQDVVLSIADAWWTWSTNARLAETAGRAVEEATALKAQTRARHEEGLVAQLELSRTTSERLGAESDALLARASMRASADQLLLVMGESPGQTIEPGGSGAIAGGEVDVDSSLAPALQSNPDVAAAQAEVEIAKNALRDARRSKLPRRHFAHPSTPCSPSPWSPPGARAGRSSKNATQRLCDCASWRT
jgi:outer membrane protein TolC